MTQDIEKYVEQALEQSRLPDIDAVHGCLHCESFDYPKLVADMCTTITKVAEEARREERSRIVEWVESKHLTGLLDGSSFNNYASKAYNNAFDDLIAHLSDNTNTNIIACKDPTDSYTGADNH